jgi:hypothetical protein
MLWILNIAMSAVQASSTQSNASFLCSMPKRWTRPPNVHSISMRNFDW